MTNLFLGFLNRSLSAAFLIFAVVLVRLAFKKAPKWLLCALWALAAVRLLCPFSIESVLSLIPSAEPVQPEIVYSAAPAITSGIPAVDAIVNPPLQAAFTPDPAQSANPLQILTWACRVGLARRLRGAYPVRGHFRAASAASRAHGGAAGGKRVPVGIRPVPVHPRRDSAKNLSALRAGARRAGHGSGARARTFKARRPALEAAGLPAPDGILVQPRLLAGVCFILPRYRGGLR